MTANTTNTPTIQNILNRGYLKEINWPGAHWFIRVPLALILSNQAWLKFIDLVGGADSYGFPVWMWFMAGLGEALAAAGLIVGGAVKSWNPEDTRIRLSGDVITRLSGLATTIIVASVIAIVYWGPWLGFQLQLMLLAGGLFFMLRGNRG